MIVGKKIFCIWLGLLLYIGSMINKMDRGEKTPLKIQSPCFTLYYGVGAIVGSCHPRSEMIMSDKTRTEDGPSQRRTISPYDITSLDNPGLLITQVQLKGENYDEWARSIRTALRARKKFGFVDGTIK